MRNALLYFILSFLILGCEKPNPEPEKLDPIYEDLLKEQSKAEGAVKSAEKELEGFEKELSAVVPQTGQIKYAQKRVSETNAKIERARQMAEYWKLRAESRRKWDRTSYLKAYNAKKPWPDPAEFEEYKVQRKLEVAPRNWNIRERLEEAKLGISLKPKGEHGEGGEKEAAPPSHE